MLAYFFWDPPRGMFSWKIPFLERPILWYGFFFALGFSFAYGILSRLLKKEETLTSHSSFLVERLSFYAAIGILIGARLFDVLFYQSWTDYIKNPISIFCFWEGGLASHGGALGLYLAILLFSKRYRKFFPLLTTFFLADYLGLIAPLVGAFIRIGNFFNQEIIGRPTQLPWGILFGHPITNESGIPRHPVQIYESLGYFFLFGVLFLLKKRNFFLTQGQLFGWSLLSIFSFRFLVEFLKEEQSAYGFFLFPFTMGQWLSLPLIFLAIWLLKRISFKKFLRENER
jgi:phosphatidylglycerol---prolipoprotein diacylglyceryl transferase